MPAKTNFVEAVDANGNKVRVPRHWVESTSPAFKAFRLPPSAKATEAAPKETK